jgi:hypothetical protein
MFLSIDICAEDGFSIYRRHVPQLDHPPTFDMTTSAVCSSFGRWLEVTAAAPETKASAP